MACVQNYMNAEVIVFLFLPLSPSFSPSLPSSLSPFLPPSLPSSLSLSLPSSPPFSFPLYNSDMVTEDITCHVHISKLRGASLPLKTTDLPLMTAISHPIGQSFSPMQTTNQTRASFTRHAHISAYSSILNTWVAQEILKDYLMCFCLLVRTGKTIKLVMAWILRSHDS